MTTQPLVVWTAIPVSNVETAAKFYDTVFGLSTTVDRSGPKPMANLNDAMAGVGVTIYEGKAAPGALIHMAVSDGLEASIERLEAAGGKVQSEERTLPVGRFVTASDPDGNMIGLFESKAM